jgi:hypothetical protein
MRLGKSLIIVFLLASAVAFADGIPKNPTDAYVWSFEDCARIDSQGASKEVDLLIANNQDALFKILEKLNYLRKGLTLSLTNHIPFVPAYNVDVRIFLDEKGEFAGIGYSFSSCPNKPTPGECASQHLFSVKELEAGVSFKDLGKDVGNGKKVQVSVAGMKAEKGALGPEGGVLDLNYMTDYQAGQQGSYRLGVRKSASGAWEFYDAASGKPLSGLGLDAVILGLKNAGIKEVVPQFEASGK